jgi:transcription antitermination factor NusG
MASDSDHEEPFKIGTQVRCFKNGSFDGKKGKVRDILDDREILKVEFEHTTLIDSRNYFEPVTGDS